MKCSNFKRLYMETDSCTPLSHMHTYLHMCCMHAHTCIQAGKRCSSLCGCVMHSWQWWEKCRDTAGVQGVAQGSA